MWLNCCSLMIKLLTDRGVAAYGWAKKMVSWDVIYSWWRYHESCWNDNIGFRISNINLVDKAEAEFERIDSKLESSTVGKILSNSILCYGEIVMKGSVAAADFIVAFCYCCSVVSDSATPWTAAHQASLSFAISWSLLKLMSIESVIPSNHLILCRPFLLLPSIFPSIRVFSNESAVCIR